MSKKTLIILIFTVLGLFLVGLISYYFIIQNNQNGSSNNNSTGFKSFFPFGGNSPTEQSSSTPETQPTLGPETNEPVGQDSYDSCLVNPSDMKIPSWF